MQLPGSAGEARRRRHSDEVAELPDADVHARPRYKDFVITR
jgi:hypothetical protein